MVAKPKKTKGKMPITRHPLFAPMVALWFATLFGIGSLAIRPTLLESIVLSLRIDLIIPAAAPPLGFTFRILLALTLFAIGGALGFVMARRFSRPAKAPAADHGRSFMRKGQAAPASAVAAPVEAEDDDDDFARLDTARQTQEDEANANANRRRSLALDEDFQNDYRDFVPLPGGDPQILDLAELGPISAVEEEFEVEPQAQFVPPFEVETAAADLALDEEAEGEAHFDPWRRHPNKVVFQPQPAGEAPQADFSQPTVAQDFSRPAAQQDFSRPSGTPDFSQPAPFAAAAGASFAVPQEFQPAPQAAEPNFAPPVAPQPAEAFEAPVARADFTPPAHEPLFTRSADGAVQAAPLAEPVSEAAVPVEYSAPTAIPPSAEQPATALPVFGQVSGDAAERLVASPVESLGVVQLAERLALAISRKRGSASAAPAAIAPEFVESAPLSPPVPVASPLPPSFAAPQPASFAAPTEFASEVAETVSAANFAAPPLPAMPAALRPLAFDDAGDDEPLEGFAIPPRGFAIPPAPVAESPAPVPIAYEPEAQVEQPAFAAPVAAEEVAQEGFASLLDIKPQGRPFVRIEEPEAQGEAIEPVVIFPGQDTRPAFHQSQAIASPPEANPGMAGRPFDAPQLGTAVPVRLPAATAPAIDPEETERQLKAALATLQRMSGAA